MDCYNFIIKNALVTALCFLFSVSAMAHACTLEFKNKTMTRAIKLAEQEVARGGLPFATIIVNQRGDVVAEAVNTVEKTHDPTDHAEIRALRMLTSQIKKSEIRDYEVYVIGHPCVMCYSALTLARPKKIYFLVTLEEKKNALKSITHEHAVPMEQLTQSRQKAFDLFKNWNQRQLQPQKKARI